MLFRSDGANEINWKEIEELLSEESQQETPPATEEVPTPDDSNPKPEKKPAEDITTTQAFAKRLRESTEKARNEEREAIAKSLGFETYDAMMKSRESKIFADKGLDPEQVKPVVDELVEQRLKNDPRMVELDELRKRQIADFAKKELKELTELTDGEITSLNQLSTEVLDMFKQTGSLRDAYLRVEGVNLVNKIKAGRSKGTTDHMANPSGSTGNASAKRSLTAEERQTWKFFNPSMTDEELDKIKVDK